MFKNLTLIAFVLLFVPAVIFLVRSKVLDTVQKKLAILVLVTLLVEVISRILWYKKINNLPIYHFYAVIEFLLILNIYKEPLRKVLDTKYLVIIGLGFTGFAILNAIFFQDLFTFNSNVTTLMGLLVVVFALSYFYALLKEVRYGALETNPMFWINSGFLIYFSSNLILFYMNNSLFKEVSEASLILWGLHAIVNIVLTIFYTIALWVRPKKLLH